MSIPIALTIAGSDSSGGAGIQADLKTFHAYGVFGTSALTAITAQNTLGVHAVHAIPPDIVRAQIAAVANDFNVGAVKSGMLATRELVELVAEMIEAEGLPNYVLDPVMVATSGDRLLDEDAISAVNDRLVRLSRLVTPNLSEAGILTGMVVDDVGSMRVAGQQLLAKGAAAVLVKGGHLSGEKVVDVLLVGDDVQLFERERIVTDSTHGTGCTLSAGIAAALAWGRTLDRAVEDAIDFVHRAIAAAPPIGHGHGPLNHFIPIHTSAAD